MEEERNFAVASGSKLEFSETKAGEYTILHGFTQIPQFGKAPSKLDTTTMENLKQKTSRKGLQEADDIEIPMNLELPGVDANINACVAMVETGKKYYYRITRGESGIQHLIYGEPYIMYNQVAPDAIDSFTLGIISNSEREDMLPTE